MLIGNPRCGGDFYALLLLVVFIGIRRTIIRKHELGVNKLPEVVFFIIQAVIQRVVFVRFKVITKNRQALVTRRMNRLIVKYVIDEIILFATNLDRRNIVAWRHRVGNANVVARKRHLRRYLIRQAIAWAGASCQQEKRK